MNLGKNIIKILLLVSIGIIAGSLSGVLPIYRLVLLIIGVGMISGIVLKCVEQCIKK